MHLIFKRLSVYIIASAAALAISAAPIDEAKSLYNAGNYDAALPILRDIVKKSPKDGTANYYLGATLSAMGQTAEAVKPLEAAAARGVNDAYQILAQDALANYDTEAADNYIDELSAKLSKAKKKTAMPAWTKDVQSRSLALKNMLDRVEKIVVVDSVQVNKSDFFKAYKLSPDAGVITDVSILPAGTKASSQSTVFIPAGQRELFWSAPNASGVLTLMHADVLDNGTVEDIEPVSANISKGADAAFPFMMSDGQTFYYGSKGEGSIGGYDIFMTRRGDDGSYFDGSNVGMPYNSTANDYMMTIDETTGLGWFATDRNAPDGKVTIYTFIPNESRVNYDPDTPGLADLAKLSSIAATQPKGFNRQSVLKALDNLGTSSSASAANGNEFTLSLGNGKIYTSLSDFTNASARAEMQKLLEERKAADLDKRKLEVMRRQYRAGDHSVKATILSLEKSVSDADRRLRTRQNAVIRMETRQ